MRIEGGGVTRTLADRRLERLLERDGYVRLQGMAAPVEVERLRALHAEFTSIAVSAPSAGAAGSADSGWRRQQTPGPHWRIGADELPVPERDRLEDEHVVYRVDDAFYRQHSPRSLHLDFPDGWPVVDQLPVGSG